MAIYVKDGKYYNTLNGIENGDFVTYNPTHEMMTEWGYEIYVPQKSEYEIASEEIESLNRQVKYLKGLLQETDYIALKSIEGYDCDTLYPGWKENRSEIREEINELEERLAVLNESIDEMPVSAPIVIEPAPTPHVPSPVAYDEPTVEEDEVDDEPYDLDVYTGDDEE